MGLQLKVSHQKITKLKCPNKAMIPIIVALSKLEWTQSRNCHILKLKKKRLWSFVLVEICNAIREDVYACCSSSDKCGLAQGDCDFDSDCIGTLVCGKNNCQWPFPSDADCCEPGKVMMFLFKQS